MSILGMSSEELVELIVKSNTNAMPFGISLFPVSYALYIEGKESIIKQAANNALILNDYITLEYTVKDFRFIHYSPETITEIKPRARDSLSFGPGIYVYSKENHKLFDTTLIAYEGIYSGPVLECVYDCDPSEIYDKSGEFTTEFLLRSETAIPVRKVCEI